MPYIHQVGKGHPRLRALVSTMWKHYRQNEQGFLGEFTDMEKLRVMGWYVR